VPSSNNENDTWSKARCNLTQSGFPRTVQRVSSIRAGGKSLSCRHFYRGRTNNPPGRRFFSPFAAIPSGNRPVTGVNPPVLRTGGFSHFLFVAFNFVWQFGWQGSITFPRAGVLSPHVLSGLFFWPFYSAGKINMEVLFMSHSGHSGHSASAITLPSPLPLSPIARPRRQKPSTSVAFRSPMASGPHRHTADSTGPMPRVSHPATAISIHSQ